MPHHHSLYYMPGQDNTTNTGSGVRQLTLSDEYEGRRLDNALSGMLRGVPKSRVYRLIRTGQVRVNGGRAKPDTRLHGGDLLRIPPVREREPDDPGNAPSPATLQQLERCILHEDKRLLVLNKPSAWAVHGGGGSSRPGLIEALRIARAEPGLQLAHRLDRGTSGVLLISRRHSALVQIHEALRSRHAKKLYWALVHGDWPAKLQCIEQPLERIEREGQRLVRISESGKAARTRIKVLQRFNFCTLVQVTPETGRTHQIRVHLASAEHPVVGDDRYGNRSSDALLTKETGFKGMFLHAKQIELVLQDEQRRFEAPLPESLQSCLERLQSRDG